MLLQEQIAADSEFKYPGTVAKNALSCWKYALHQTQP